MVETVLAAVLAVVELALLGESGLTFDAAIIAALSVVMVAAASRVPVVASAVSLLLVASTFITDGAPMLFSLFFSMLIIEIVTAGGYVKLGAVIAVAHWALAAVDTTDWTVTTDPVALGVVAVILLAGYMTGWYRATHHRQRERLRESLIEQERRQRRELAQDLHDSVATSLTSVVMQSQALPLIPPEDDARRQQSLESISESSREALSHLRTMLQLLTDDAVDSGNRRDDPGSTGTDSEAVHRALAKAESELQSHGLQVVTADELPEGTVQVTAEVAAVVTTGLAEMTANATKHAPRSATVVLDCRIDDGELLVTVTNPLRDAAERSPDELVSSGLGLASVRTRTLEVGGEFTAGVQRVSTGDGSERESVWRATLQVPIVVIKS